MANSDETPSDMRVDDRSNQQPQSNKKGQKKKNRNGFSNQFKGMTTEMNGHVFQVHSEQKRKGQFEETLRALELYASKIYKNDMVHLTALFKDLVAPILNEPIPPEGKRIVKTKDQQGNDVEEKFLTEGQKLMYTERLKKFVNQEEQMKIYPGWNL